MRPARSTAGACSLVVLLAGGLLAATAATSQATSRVARATRTHHSVVRPVDAAGDPASGWSVKRKHGVRATCGDPAPAAVDDGISECFPSAAYLPACWRSHRHTVLCLQDPRDERLVRVRYDGAFGSPTAPKRPSPQALNLWHGQTCNLRVGGAWGVLPSHPTWVGFYSCSNGLVYGPPSGDGVIRRHPVWRVHVWKSQTKDTVVVRRVRTAFFVGNHR